MNTVKSLQIKILKLKMALLQQCTKGGPGSGPGPGRGHTGSGNNLTPKQKREANMEAFRQARFENKLRPPDKQKTVELPYPEIGLHKDFTGGASNIEGTLHIPGNMGGGRKKKPKHYSAGTVSGGA